LVVAFFVEAVQTEDGSDVVILGDDNFDAAVTADATWLVEFYAPCTLHPEATRCLPILPRRAGHSFLTRVGATSLILNGTIF
jgi:hypothetical protein